jgi:hypothetical protein
MVIAARAIITRGQDHCSTGKVAVIKAEFPKNR